MMQGQPIFQSPHFPTGSVVVVMLATNGAISMTKFGGGRAALRPVHAYLGTAAVALLFVHGCWV